MLTLAIIPCEVATFPHDGLPSNPSRTNRKILPLFSLHTPNLPTPFALTLSAGHPILRRDALASR